MKPLPFCLLLFLAPSAEAALTGRVATPANEPMPGVAVTDGLNVVKTAADGAFTLPGDHPKARFVTVTTPSGYRAKDAYYQPVDPAKTTYDFTLEPWDRIAPDGSHAFVQIADTEIRGADKKHDLWADNIRDYAKNERAAFIVHTGDICYEGGLKAHLPLMNSHNMACPVYYGIGNHDLVQGQYGEALFESIYGPAWYSFDAGNIHYLMTPMPGGDHRPSYTTAEVAAWLKNDLAQLPPGKPVVVFNHDLLSFSYGGIPLQDFNLKAWIHGHWHTNFTRRQSGVTTFATAAPDKGGIDHSASVFRVLRADPAGNLASELRYAGINRCFGANLAADGTLAVNAYRSASPVKSIAWFTRDYSKKPLATTPETPLARMTDWSWTATGVPTNTTLAIHVYFADGSVIRDEFRKPLPAQPPAPGAPWPALLADSTHSGQNAAALKAPLAAAWIRNTGANIFMASPLFKDGKVFIGTVDENLTGQAAAFALHAATGAILWRAPVRNSIKNNMAIHADTLFAQDAEGWLYAFDTATGALRWERKLPVAGLPALVEGLTVADGIVYAGAGKGLSAWTPSGEKLWENTAWAQREGTAGTLAVGNGVLIQGAQWGALHGHDAATGKQLWKLDSPAFRACASSARIDGDKTYLISKDSLFILETKTGNVLTSKKLDENLEVTSTPLLTEKLILFGSATGGLIALHRATLDLAWQRRTEPALIHTPPYVGPGAPVVETSPILVGDAVFLAASDGALHVLDLATGDYLWRRQLGAPVFATPAVSGNTLFLVDFGGNVYAFTPEKKQLL